MPVRYIFAWGLAVVGGAIMSLMIATGDSLIALGMSPTRASLAFFIGCAGVFVGSSAALALAVYDDRTGGRR